MNEFFFEHVDRLYAVAYDMRDDQLRGATALFERSIGDGIPIVLAGNGGSYCDALHFAEELTGRYALDRSAYPAFVLGANGGHLTCVGNDYGFDMVFRREAEAFGSMPCLPIILSTSGTSPNIMALRGYYADTERDCILLTGRSAGAIHAGEVVVNVPHSDTAIIQEVHKMIIHEFCAAVDRRELW